MSLYCSEELAKLAARKYARIVQKLGFPVCILALFVAKVRSVVISDNSCSTTYDTKEEFNVDSKAE